MRTALELADGLPPVRGLDLGRQVRDRIHYLAPAEFADSLADPFSCEVLDCPEVLAQHLGVVLDYHRSLALGDSLSPVHAVLEAEIPFSVIGYIA